MKANLVKNEMKLQNCFGNDAMKYPKLGDPIKVSASHWSRAHERGVIVAELPKSRYEILFDKFGIGYGDGKLLTLDFKDFEVIE